MATTEEEPRPDPDVLTPDTPQVPDGDDSENVPPPDLEEE